MIFNGLQISWMGVVFAWARKLKDEQQEQRQRQRAGVPAPHEHISYSQVPHFRQVGRTASIRGFLPGLGGAENAVAPLITFCSAA
jgi:hypothetical protein